jgi:DNA-directed RNA polymerase subunit alpha
MLKYRNFGKQSLKEISEILSGMGLHLGMDVDALLGGKAPRPSSDQVPMDGDLDADADADVDDDDSDSDSDSEIAIENS